MKPSAPAVSVIVPARPGQQDIVALSAVAELRCLQGGLEVMVARGRQPAVQRNVAVRRAQGEFIYFLDDDAQPRPDNWQVAARHFQRPEVAMVGGPNLCPADAPWLERVFAVVLASALAFGPSRARYEQVGQARHSGEKELILCNLMARRADFLAAGGFNEALYPNEENALMDTLQKRGRILVYDPEFVAYRRPRPTLRAFGKMLMTYGRGRAEQFRLHPTVGSTLNFVPPLFCLYVVIAPWLNWWGLVPLGFYGVALAGQFVVSALRKGFSLSAASLPLVVLTHVLYGVGFWRGLFTRIDPAGSFKAEQVELEIIDSDRRGEETVH